MILIGCVLLGIIMGIAFPFCVPLELSHYVAILILALMDTVLGGFSAMSRKCFDMNVFISGFLGNAFLALLLTFIGVKLDADLYLVGLIVFGTRLFNNFSVIRRHYISEIKIKLKK